MTSCSIERDPEYPKFIVDNGLEKLYDKAKWELYKLNSVGLSENETDLIFCIENDSIQNRFWTEKQSYDSIGSNIFEDYEKIEGIFGEDNAIKYIESNLFWLGPDFLDTTEIINGNRVQISFLPEFSKDCMILTKLTSGYHHTIGFANDTVQSVGVGRFIWDLSEKHLISLEEKFENYLKENEEIQNDWIRNYEKAQNNR